MGLTRPPGTGAQHSEGHQQGPGTASIRLAASEAVGARTTGGGSWDRTVLHSSLTERGTLSPRAQPQQQACPATRLVAQCAAAASEGTSRRPYPRTGPQTTRWRQPGAATPVPTCMVGRRAGGPGQTAHSPKHSSHGRQQHGAQPSLGGTSQPARCCGPMLTAPRQAPAARRAVAHLPDTRRPPRSKGDQQT